MVELRAKKGPKETFGYKKQKCAKDPQVPSATGKEFMEEKDEEENKEEESDKEDEESDSSLRESIVELQVGHTNILSRLADKT